MQVEAIVFWLVSGLPGAPGMMIRYMAYKLFFKHLAGFCWVQHGVTLVQTNHLRVGKNFGCNTGTYINAVGGITIGDYVLIGSNVTISSGTHPIEGRVPPIITRPTVPQAIVIEDDVWIAAGVVILPGVTLKCGSVIGANAVVVRDTDAYGIYVGAPARCVGSRDRADGPPTR
jgi:acetyltransferase-like isoleucine patch superfamily enzyme